MKRHTEYIKLLFGKVLAGGLKKRKTKYNTFRCSNCGCECDIEDRVIDNCCLVCVSGLGYPHNVYWSNTDPFITRCVK
jgi:hypothetical protein